MFSTFHHGGPESLDEGVDDDEDEGDEKVEEKPDVNHLQVGGVRQAVINLDISLGNNICISISINFQYHCQLSVSV